MYNAKTYDRLCTISDVVNAIISCQLTITALYEYIILSNNESFLDYCSYNQGHQIIEYINKQKKYHKNCLLSAEDCEMMNEIYHYIK